MSRIDDIESGLWIDGAVFDGTFGCICRFVTIVVVLIT